MQHSPSAITLQQAALQSEPLARLSKLIDASNARLRVIAPLIPTTLRGSVKAGPLKETQWCLLVNSNATATKLRQLSPVFVTHLQKNGFDTQTILIKVQLSSFQDPKNAAPGTSY